MTRYVGTQDWLDVDQQHVTVGSPTAQTPAVWPLQALTAAANTPTPDGGGVLTMVFTTVGRAGELVSLAQEVSLAYGPQTAASFQALVGWLGQVVTVNHQQPPAQPTPVAAPLAAPAATPTAAPTASPAQTVDGLPVVDPSGVPLMLHPGEVIHGLFQAQLLKQTVQREFRGGSAGFSFPLGHGIRMRTGSMRGHSVVVGTTSSVADTGPLIVTSTRTVFVGRQHTLEFDYPKLVGLRQYKDGLSLSVSNRQTTSTFQLAKHENPAQAVSLISRSAA